jgi:peptidoglycan/xylan/chitin deacetylase (PgdA/CDA1 family)
VEILLYHGFCDGSERDSRFPRLMPIRQFEEQIKLFARYGKPLQLEELLVRAQGGLAVTFDDGYANNYRLAFPVLQKYGFPATVFVTTGFVDGTTPLWGDWLEFLVTEAQSRNIGFAPYPAAHGEAPPTVTGLKQYLSRLPIDEIHEFLRTLEAHLQVSYSGDAVPAALRPLRWEQIREMRRSGIVSFGSHTVSHPFLSRCTEGVQRSELARSKRRIEEELGEACSIFAYPYGKRGDYTDLTKQIAKESGYGLALSAESGSNLLSSWDRHELRRWGADISGEELSFVVAGGPRIARYLRWAFPR